MKYDRIDISEGIDVNRTDRSKERMLCHYWYFLNKNFKYRPYLCDICYNIVQRSTDFKNITIVCIKKMHTEFISNAWINMKQKKL